MEQNDEEPLFGDFKAPFVHNRWEEYPKFSTSAGAKPQPQIFGFNDERRVLAELLVWPPTRVAPGEKMDLAAMIKISPPPDPYWITTVCRMIASPIREKPEVDQFDKKADMCLATQHVGWRKPGTFKDFDELYFKFENVAFPEEGKFEVRFEVNVTQYFDPGETPRVEWPPEHLWPFETPMEIRLGTSKESRDLYKETGFCAGILVVGGFTHVHKDFKKQWWKLQLEKKEHGDLPEPQGEWLWVPSNKSDYIKDINEKATKQVFENGG